MFEKLNHPHIGIFVLAWLVSDIITAILIKISPRIKAVDVPHSYKTHKTPTSFLGGVGIYIAFATSLFSILRFTSFSDNLPLFIIIICSFIILLIGLIDDFIPYSAAIKLVLLFMITVLLSKTGIKINFFPANVDFLNLLFALVWIVGMTSAVNSLDHHDGLAGGICAIASATVFYIAWKNYPAIQSTEWHLMLKWLSFISIAVFGSLIGFLRYNFIGQARIFLGDNGSLTLGFILASSSILGSWSEGDRLRSFIVPCAILVIPLFDITLSTFLRYRQKTVHSFYEAVIYCGKDHISHRLMALGFSKRESTLLIFNIGILGGIFAIIISNPALSTIQYSIITLFGMLCLLMFAIMLSNARLEIEKLRNHR